MDGRQEWAAVSVVIGQAGQRHSNVSDRRAQIGNDVADLIAHRRQDSEVPVGEGIRLGPDYECVVGAKAKEQHQDGHALTLEGFHLGSGSRHSAGTIPHFWQSANRPGQAPQVPPRGQQRIQKRWGDWMRISRSRSSMLAASGSWSQRARARVIVKEKAAAAKNTV